MYLYQENSYKNIILKYFYKRNKSIKMLFITLKKIDSDDTEYDFLKLKDILEHSKLIYLFDSKITQQELDYSDDFYSDLLSKSTKSNYSNFEEIIEDIKIYSNKNFGICQKLSKEEMNIIDLNHKCIDRPLTEYELKLLIKSKKEFFKETNDYYSYSKVKIKSKSILPEYDKYNKPLELWSLSEIETSLINTLIECIDIGIKTKEEINLIRKMIDIFILFYTIKNDNFNLMIFYNYKSQIEWDVITNAITSLENRVFNELDSIKMSIGSLYLDSNSYKNRRKTEIKKVLESIQKEKENIVDRIDSIPFDIDTSTFEKVYSKDNKELRDNLDKRYRSLNGHSQDIQSNDYIKSTDFHEKQNPRKIKDYVLTDKPETVENYSNSDNVSMIVQLLSNLSSKEKELLINFLKNE